MRPVGVAVAGAEMIAGGPGVKSIESSYNGNCPAAKLALDLSSVTVWDTKKEVRLGDEICAEGQRWSTHIWRAFAERISNDKAFRDQLLTGNIEAFELEPHVMTGRQKFEQTVVNNENGAIYEWRVFDRLSAPHGDEWRPQEIVISNSSEEMRCFVDEVRAGGFAFEPDIDEVVADWMERAKAHSARVGEMALASGSVLKPYVYEVENWAERANTQGGARVGEMALASAAM